RAGSADAVVYDDDDYHWHLGSEEPQVLLVQVVRGKRLVGELFLEPEKVTYVQAGQGDADGEVNFELVNETGNDRYVLFYFVLAHGYEEAEESSSRHVH